MLSVTTRTPLSVYIIERQLLFGKAIAQVLARDPDIVVSGVTGTRETCSFGATKPDIILVDIDNETEDVASLVEYCRNECPTARICLLSIYVQPEVMQRCLSAGADGYIVKDTSIAELTSAVKTLGEGAGYVDPRVAANLLRRRSQTPIPSSSQLSPREADIIRLIAQGLSNRDIGQRLVLSEKTVKNHVSRIFSKLHFTARSQAAVHAVRNGLA